MKPIEKGISIAYDLEINNYMMTRYINKMRNETNQLGKARYRNVAPEKKARESSIIGAMFTSAAVCATIAAVIGAIVGFATIDSFLDLVLGWMAMGIVYGLYGGLGGLVIGFIIGLIAVIKEKQTIEDEYQAVCVKHEHRLNEDKARVQQELKIKKVLESQLHKMEIRERESVRLLNAVYRDMKIDPEYRNIVPIGYMNEFIRLGISNHLEGTDGLYYLVRKELRYDQMQYTLSDISRKLDTLIDQNHALYCELKQIDQKCDRLVSETEKSVRLAVRNNQKLESIAESTAVIAYNTERIRLENSYQTFLLAMSDY